jgi:MoxR-like ATPase
MAPANPAEPPRPDPLAPPAPESVRRFGERFARLNEQLSRVIVGQDAVREGVLLALAAGGHVLLEGVPGLGKTLLVRCLAQALRLDFKRVQFTPDLMPADILGTQILVEDGGQRRLAFQQGPVFTSLLLADEVNRATPKTQSALLEAMAEGNVTVGGVHRPLPRPFFVLATQNPLEMEGTYPLPEAQLDRFLVKVLVPFPSLDELSAIVDRTTGSETPEAAGCMDGAELLEMQRTVREVIVAEPVKRYALRLVLGTHPQGEGASRTASQYLRYGSSPRGAQAIILLARARALLRGRAHVSMEDVRAAALPAMRHRIIRNFEAESEGLDADTLLGRVLEEVPETEGAVAGEPVRVGAAAAAAAAGEA